MHGTQGQRKESLLLLENSTVSLCLRCHNGSSPQAPNVLVPGAGSWRDGMGGGGFQRGWGASQGAHLLELPIVLPEIGEVTLTCITCHDPHGNANFRDLRPDPLADPREKRSNGAGIQVGARERDVRRRGRRRYEGRNILYREGLSPWCQRCHADLYQDLRGRGIRHHPVDILVEEARDDGFEPLPLFSSSTPLPVEDPQEDTVYGLSPSGMADDRVICLTCHYAHGSANPKALRYADGFSLESTCQQCHPRGRGGAEGWLSKEKKEKQNGRPAGPWQKRRPMRGPIR
ncbi:MAG: hypothetical protein HYY20_08885 [Candidatus Tectomicrobia bacterium]|uniref:Doubled CXXCH motif domain-containing protein n=1 Tax=Tectimicrobiota bacterium TaxID=2528274 RepID=A0A932CQX2_UNCTE|nr:hypothetical protein [Candidatus Tectomicrobia bacterium]